MARATAGRAGRRRFALLVAAGVLLLVDLLLKWWAEADLPGRVISLGLIDLRLAFNPGVAFSLGAGMPSWIVLTITGLISAGVAVFAWREAPKIPLAGSLGLAAVLGGALGNVIDRAGDGVVTDYLHTGWWPTFNLADVFIIGGAGLLLLATAFQHRSAGQSDGMKTSRTAR